MSGILVRRNKFLYYNSPCGIVPVTFLKGANMSLVDHGCAKRAALLIGRLFKIFYGFIEQLDVVGILLYLIHMHRFMDTSLLYLCIHMAYKGVVVIKLDKNIHRG